MESIIKEFENKIKNLIDGLKQNLLGVRTNRPSPKMVEDILAEAYGQKMPIKQLGAISVVPSSQIQISAWDKGVVSSIAKAIENSNLNVNANIDGNLIKINLPPLSDERRNELIKVVKKEVEELKIKTRVTRDESIKKINKGEEEGKITEDQKFKSKEEIQKLIEKSNKEIEEILEKKIAEINE